MWNLNPDCVILAVALQERCSTLKIIRISNNSGEEKKTLNTNRNMGVGEAARV